MKPNTRRAVLSAAGLLLSASNALAADGNAESWTVLGQIGNAVSGVVPILQGPLDLLADNLARLFVAVPILVIMWLVVTKKAHGGGSGKSYSEQAQADQDIQNQVFRWGKAVIAIGLIGFAGGKYVGII